MGLFKKSNSQPAPKSKPGQSSTSISAPNHANASNSNLSTTSTLIPSSSRPAPAPAPTGRMTSYEAFLSDAQQTESKRQEKLDREERTARAWVAARLRRESGRQGDPWRGGFGPPPAGEGSDVGRWLDHNGLVKK